jgi:formamidopyrimidine-DNA glycosylase
MPELPEVEYNRKRLARWLRGARIAAARTDDARVVRPVSPRSFVERVSGRAVVRVDRRGKWIRWLLDDDQRIFIHLGMTGWFERERRGDPQTHTPRPAITCASSACASSSIAGAPSLRSSTSIRVGGDG